MRFGRPDILLASLGILPLLGLFLWWTWRERQRLITQFVQSRLLAVLTVGVSRRRQKARLWLLVLGVAATLVALSRPQWGFGYQEVKQRGLDIVVAIDTSKSMLAEDVAPNRLARAKLAALDLRRLSRSDRVGLIAFAGSAFLQMPMSVDEDVFRQHLDSLDTSTLPQGGTAIAEAIQTARNTFKAGSGDNHRALVIFTDGEDHDPSALEAATAAAKDGLHIFTIGIGTPDGELLRVHDAKGRTDFIKDEEGNVVKSRLNESLLQDVARAGGGFYLRLAATGTMETLHERGISPLPKIEFQSARMRQYFERFQWFLGLALLLVIAELFLPDRNPPVKAPTPPAGPLDRRHPSVAAALWIPFLGLGLAHLVSIPAVASPSSARRDYDSGKFKTALSEYERLLEKAPSDSPLHYNAGAAAYQAGKFEAATEHFSAALATPDLKLQEKAYYNRGNSRFRAGQEAGEPPKTEALWKQAISDYETALKLDPNDKEAGENLDVVKRRLEELQKQQQQQQKQEGQDKKDQKDQEKNKDQEKKDQDPQKKDSDQGGEKKDPEKQDSQKDSKQDSESQKKKESQDQEQKQGDPKQQEKKDSQEGQSDSGQEKKDGEKKPSAQATPKESKGDPKEGGEPAGSMQPMQMTRQQAIQLLEALRSEERLLMTPPPTRTNRNQRVFKDW